MNTSAKGARGVVGAVTLALLATGSSIGMYFINTQYLDQLRVNASLIEQAETADATLEMVLIPKDGTILVRVNKRHVHSFPNACPSLKSL